MKKPVYEYCDNWCEKCPVTSECAKFSSVAVKEPDNWLDKALPDSVMDLDLSEWSTPEGLSAGEFTSKIEQMENEEQKEFLLSYCDHYAHLYDLYLSPEEDPLSAYLESLLDQLQLNIADAETNAMRFKDALESIQWYRLQLLHKVKIALELMKQDKRRTSDEQNEDSEAFYQSPANGNAKAALVAVSRSIKGWEYIVQLVEKEEAVLDIMLTLSRIRLLILTIFPDAAYFLRPGLDT